MLAILPGLTIVFMVLGLNLMGDGLRDVLDPRTAEGAGMIGIERPVPDHPWRSHPGPGEFRP